MKKIILVLLAISATALISCTGSQDSFGYVSPPPTQQDMYSNESGDLQQGGGVVAEIRSEQGNPADNSVFTLKE